ncbi:serine hydrolase [Pseudanabaena sp. FACHB-2040]|uniref:serine hydrolase n=1 Tax=Pseudanabaena sp. FACHB-2040 TaxID=2692859 RepID=UPI001686028B|nr:serine hydrolase [Pseudanabaena sp. FACHB-2040]MBD2258479.1 serine hydrolase [Pseudanabaena sp. FACHB-2040]
MSQYGDPKNIFRPPFRRHTPPTDGPSPETPVDRTAPDLRLPQPPPTTVSRGSAPNPGSPSQPPTTDWNARRRNQWREQQQISSPLTPPNSTQNSGTPNRASVPRPEGMPMPPTPPTRKPLQLPSPPPHAVAAAAAAANPRFQPIPVQRPAAGPAQPPLTPTPARPPLPPERTPLAAPTPRTHPSPSSKVTPLRSRRVSRLPTADFRESERHPNRPRRKPRKPPLPMLYAIRLLILGIGVAAIAGTLLSTLSPTQLSASNQAPSAQETVAGSAGLGLRGRPATASVQNIRLTDEITRLKTELEQLTTLTPGLTQGSFLLDLDSGRYADVSGSKAVAAASTIKVPILVAFLQAVDAGTVTLDQALTLESQYIVGGSGELQTQQVGTQYTALDIATWMIVTSDNTATNMMIALLGGAEALNQQFQTWGLASTVIRNALPDLQGTNTTSPRDLALLMALVDRGDMLSMRSRDRMLSIMQRTQNRSLIPSGISDGGAIVVNKTGDIATVLADVALIDTANGKRYVLATLIERPDNDGRAGELIRRIADRVDKELNQPTTPVGAAAPAPTVPGADGSAPQEGFTTSPSRPARYDPRNVSPASPNSSEDSSDIAPIEDISPAEPESVPGDRMPQG